MQNRKIFPVRPKKPLVSFMLYRIDKQKEIKTKGVYEISKISKKISLLWKNEKEEIKELYKEKYENSKKYYLLEIIEYKKKVKAFLEEKDKKKFRNQVEENRKIFIEENIVKKIIRKKKIKKIKNHQHNNKKNSQTTISSQSKNSELPKKQNLKGKINKNIIKKKNEIPNIIYFLNLIDFE